MDVDVDIELARQLEDAVDLAGLVAVVARRAADHLGAALEALDQQLVGSGIVDQAFLRKHADLDIDRPLVVGDQRLHALEAAHADAGIDLDLRAHAGGAVLDAVLERVRGARAHILNRHALLQRRDALDRAELAALLRRAAVDDARLVEMDVRLDQARADEVPPGVIDLRLGGQAALDRGDAALRDADIHGSVRGTIGEPRVADDEVHSFMRGRIFCGKPEVHFSGKCSDRPSLGFDVGGLDQRPPLLDLRLVVGGERLGGLLLARRNLLAEASQPLAHRRIGERIHGGGGELANGVGRRALGDPESIPGGDVDAGRAGLVDRGNAGAAARRLPDVTA